MTDLIGQTIGQYQIVELIHRGENTVYKGFQASMNRYVAVKVLNPALAANPTFGQQFQRDLQRITALQHPNMLPIYDYGQQGDLFYIVSQYVETGTLKDRLPPAFSPQQAQAMLTPIAEALDFAYRSGVGHGNLKPSNILIDAQGRPLVTDLGYVQGIDVGGPENVYPSPEQAQGAVPDLRSDVYALGVLLYHMLAGELPLPGAAFNVRARRPELPAEVEKVILKATAQSPELRFQSPGQLAEAFDRALMPQAAPQPPPPAAPQAAPPAAKPKRGGPSWLVVLLVGALVALCCLTGGLGLFFVGGERDAAAPTATPPPDTGQPAPEPTPPPDGSILQGLFDLIGRMFDTLVGIIDSILGGGAPPPEPSPEPPGEQSPAEQLPAEPAEQLPPEEGDEAPTE